MVYMVHMHFTNVLGSQLEVVKIDGPAGLAPVVFLDEGLGSISSWTARRVSCLKAVCEAAGHAGVGCSYRG